MIKFEGSTNPSKISGRDATITGYLIHARTEEGDCEAYWGKGGMSTVDNPYTLKEINDWMEKNKEMYHKTTRWRLKIAKVTIKIEHHHL